MKKSFFKIVVMTAAALSVGSCGDSQKGWSIAGDVVGSEDFTLTVEGFNNGTWYVVDSIRTSKGKFSYASPTAASYPEIMRLGLGNQYIYFPIDSIDKISIVADADRFATDYKLGGSRQARTIYSIDSLINVSIAEKGAEVTSSDPVLKRELFELAFDDPGVLPLFYLVNKSAGEYQFFDLANPTDLRMIGAVAQRFSTLRPEDPRGVALASEFKKAKSKGEPESIVVEVPETSIIDIERYDNKGQKHSLAEMASKGDVVVLSFTAYCLEASPAYNVILNGIYEKYKAKGLKIYQIAFDTDEAFWKENVKNIPWTAVWNSTTDGTDALVKYNVGAIPTTFIIDRHGEIVARVEDPTKLEEQITKYL